MRVEIGVLIVQCMLHACALMEVYYISGSVVGALKALSALSTTQCKHSPSSSESVGCLG